MTSDASSDAWPCCYWERQIMIGLQSAHITGRSLSSVHPGCVTVVIRLAIHVYFRSQEQQRSGSPVFVLAVKDHVWFLFCSVRRRRLLEMPTVFSHIVISSFSLPSFRPTQIRLITRVIGTNMRCPLSLKLDILGAQHLPVAHDEAALPDTDSALSCSF